MSDHSTEKKTGPADVFVPASRTTALSRGLVWSVPTFALGGSAFLVYRSLSFRPTGINNRLVDYVIGVAASPLAIGALVCAFMGVRWLLLSLWPGRVGVFAGRDELILRLGPFGTKRYDTAQLETRYPFELSGDEDEGDYEAFLPEDKQKETLLPRMRHPPDRTRIDRNILRCVAEQEASLAEELRPVIESWRHGPNSPSDRTSAIRKGG